MSKDACAFYVLDTIQAAPPGRYASGYCLNCVEKRCPVCGVWLSGTVPAEVVFEVPDRSRPGFYAEALRSLNPVFRHDMVDLWISSGLTGLSLFPVKLVSTRRHGALRNPAPKYDYVSIDGRARLIRPPSLFNCPACGFTKYDFEVRSGIDVDASTWDGSDFFQPAYYSGIVLCTDRVARATLEAGYNKAIAFVRAEEWGTWEPFDPSKWTSHAYDRMLNEQYLIRDPQRLVG